MAKSKIGPDLEVFWKEMKKLRATRGNTRDDVADLPDSLPLGGTTAIFLTAPRKRDNKADEDAPTLERENLPMHWVNAPGKILIHSISECRGAGCSTGTLITPWKSNATGFRCLSALNRGQISRIRNLRSSRIMQTPYRRRLKS